jgi:micrococcal nuclease
MYLTKAKTMRQKILFLLLVLFISETTFSVPLRVKKSNYKFYPVTKVIDGDTFWINDGSSKGLKVRLIGVDAPESRNTGRKVKAIYGKESSDYLTRLIGGKKVRLEYDVDHFDQYGRTLAYVYLLNGIFVNANLVKNGYAMVMTVPPNVKYADTFLRLARKARNNRKGLWGEESISLP